MNILLIGYRGSGKTSVGKLLAADLGWPFFDTDEEVRRAMGNLSIAEIWQRFGEAAFRKAECDRLAELLKKDRQVLALGGGTPLQKAARQAIGQSPASFCVYLKCPAEELDRRLKLDPQTSGSRPALTASGGGLEEIRSVLKAREPVYESLARLTLDAGMLSPADLARAIRRQLSPSP